MSSEIIALRESIATLESQLREAEGRAVIMQAQLAGWEAACAAQMLAASAYLKTLRHVGHTDLQLAARHNLEHSIDSNAGEMLLARLRPADELADAVEQFHEMSRAAELDPARRLELAAAAYRLGASLASYRNAQKART